MFFSHLTRPVAYKTLGPLPVSLHGHESSFAKQWSTPEENPLGKNTKNDRIVFLGDPLIARGSSTGWKKTSNDTFSFSRLRVSFHSDSLTLAAATSPRITSTSNYNRSHTAEDKPRNGDTRWAIYYIARQLRRVTPPGTSPVSGYYVPLVFHGA
ncbi:uncharacterized protein LOC143151734 [Ptiloglossa arizonensis]|uniref:uncharacterized protein LOC143151734 n=1 Tax=Ptiloglossa arizonensis TaxID=3350558 RepID=UPI003FA05512